MSESLAIFHCLERLQPKPALLPSDPFAAGKVLELACHIVLDVELKDQPALSGLIGRLAERPSIARVTDEAAPS